MKIITLEVTPQLLETAQHIVSYEAGQIPDSGVGVAAASEVFGWDPEGHECLRFGKVLGLRRGPGTLMPLLPEVYFSAVDAQECDPDVINIRSLHEGEVVSAFWKVFFRDQLETMGGLAVNCLLDGRNSDEPTADRHQYARGLHYVASVVDPAIAVPGLEPTRYDGFDVLSYMGLAVAKNVGLRRQIANDLQEAAQRIRSGDRGGADNDELILSLHNLFRFSARDSHS